MKLTCPHFESNHCRSCSWIQLNAEEQIQKKEEQVLLNLLQGDHHRLEPTQRSDSSGFRNRAKLSVTGTPQRPIVGLTGPASELDLGRELLDCPLHHPEINRLIQQLPEWITQAKLTPYQIENKKGELKGVILYYSPISEKMMLRWILRSKHEVHKIKKHLPTLLQKAPALECVTANIQPIPHALLEGPDEIFLTLKSSLTHTWITESARQIKTQLAPQAFVQTHFELACRLYQTAARWVKAHGPQQMIDLFCGQGAFSFFCAPHVPQILGIEISASAVQAAQLSAEKNGWKQIQFIAAEAEEVLHPILKFAPNPELILVNPPRRGLGKTVETLLSCQPQVILYSSCSIESLKRDVDQLSPFYAIKKAQIFDFFPHTPHFETLVWLELKTPASSTRL